MPMLEFADLIVTCARADSGGFEVGTSSSAPMPRSAKRTPSTKRSLAIVTGVVLVGSGLGLSIAAGGAPSSGGALTCNPSTVQVATARRGHDWGHAQDASCELVFTDSSTQSGYGATPRRGRQVCFTTAAPNVVSGESHHACSFIDHRGRATGTFTGFQIGSATVTATESLHDTIVGSATVSISVVASTHKGHDSSDHTSH